MPKYTNRIGHKYGRLTVVRFGGRNEQSIKQRTVLWYCDCDCGTKNYLVNARNLHNNRVRSCGCLLIEQSRKAGISKALPGKLSAETRLYKKYKSNAKKRELDFNLTQKQFLDLVYMPCYYCGTDKSDSTIAHRRYLDDIKIEHNGVDRINSKVGYIISNCVPCCKHCNWAKKEMDLDFFKAHILKICAHLGLK